MQTWAIESSKALEPPLCDARRCAHGLTTSPNTIRLDKALVAHLKELVDEFGIP